MIYKADFFYYRQYKEESPEDQFMHYKMAVAKLWGGIQTPAAIDEVKPNVIANLGGEYAHHYGIGSTPFELAGFVDFHANRDKLGYDFNNQIRVGGGGKLVWPIEGGEIFFGAKSELSYLTKTSENYIAPQLVVGWYKFSG